MNERDLQNEKLDQIGRNLLKTAKLSDDEIEKIIGAPRLFDSVLTKIKIEESLRQQTTPGVLAIEALTIFLFRQKVVVAFGIITFLLIGAAIFTFKQPASHESVEHKAPPEAEQKFAPLENSVQPSEIEKAKVTKTKNPIRRESINFKRQEPKTARGERKRALAKLRQTLTKQEPEVFYSLSPFGTWEADGEIMQIVRTEISRAELFALGVNLAVENETEKVKTDLLVGGDGIARAFRLIE